MSTDYQHYASDYIGFRSDAHVPLPPPARESEMALDTTTFTTYRYSWHAKRRPKNAIFAYIVMTCFILGFCGLVGLWAWKMRHAKTVLVVLPPPPNSDSESQASPRKRKTLDELK